MPHEIKVNGYKPSKWPSRPEMNVDAHEKPAVQPDWNQNDETASDYIKNRPFYDTAVALPKELITDVQDLVEYKLQPYVGKEFFDHLADCTVRYAGVDYKFDTAESITFSGATFIGVGCHPVKTPSCPPLTSSDVPFVIFRVKTQPSTVLDNQPAYVNIHNMVDGNKDIEIFHTNIKQIDPKFLPMATSDTLGVVQPVEATTQMKVPVGVADDGRLFSENPTIDVYRGSGMELNVFNQLAAGKTVRYTSPFSELNREVMLLPYNEFYSGSGYKQYRGIAIAYSFSSDITACIYHYTSENGIDGAKLTISPVNNEIVGLNIKGNAVDFCGKTISTTTLTEAESIYHAQRPLLTYNNEPFITAELTDSSITIVYMGKGEDGQYGVQKTTFGGITWKSETT